MYTHALHCLYPNQSSEVPMKLQKNNTPEIRINSLLISKDEQLDDNGCKKVVMITRDHYHYNHYE